MKYITPKDKLVTIQVNKTDNGFEAVFDWNEGELNSKTDYEIPMFGEGKTEAEAIGQLIIAYQVNKT